MPVSMYLTKSKADQLYLRRDGSNKMLADLNLDTHSIKWSDLKIIREPEEGLGIKVMNLAETEHRDIWCRMISPEDFKFPILVPSSPAIGSAWYESATDTLWIYGGFPPDWHAHSHFLERLLHER